MSRWADKYIYRRLPLETFIDKEVLKQNKQFSE